MTPSAAIEWERLCPILHSPAVRTSEDNSNAVKLYRARKIGDSLGKYLLRRALPSSPSRAVPLVTAPPISRRTLSPLAIRPGKRRRDQPILGRGK